MLHERSLGSECCHSGKSQHHFAQIILSILLQASTFCGTSQQNRRFRMNQNGLYFLSHCASWWNQMNSTVPCNRVAP